MVNKMIWHIIIIIIIIIGFESIAEKLEEIKKRMK